MFKKYYVLAIVSFLLIPVISILGAMLFNSINPEIAAGHPNYGRNYRLLDLARNLSLLSALLVNGFNSIWRKIVISSSKDFWRFPIRAGI
jgi:hypothetical protein